MVIYIIGFGCRAFMLQDARLFRREIVETAQQCVNTHSLTHTHTHDIIYHIIITRNRIN